MTETVEVQEPDRAVLTEPAQDQPRQKPLRAHAERIVEAGRSQVGRARQLRDDERVRARAHRMRTALGELRDGLEASRRDADQEFLRQFHVRGDLNLPVRPELLSAYQRERDRIENARKDEAQRRANRTEWEAGLEFAQRNAGTLTGGGGLVVAVSDLLGILPVPNAAALLGGAVGCGWCWLKTRALRKSGREYRELENRRAGYLDPEASPAGSVDEDATIGLDFLTTVLREAGAIAGPSSANPAGEQIKLLAPVTSDEFGWETVIQLPSTTTAALVAAKRDRVAAAINPNFLIQQVTLTPESIGVVRLRCYNEMPFTGAPVASPVVADRHANLSEPLPMALDIHHQVVNLDLPSGRHVLIVAKSGNGKTTTWLNSLLMAMAADPNASAVGFDGKSEGGFDPFVEYLDWYIDRETPNWHEALAEHLEAEVELMRERQQRIRAGQTVGERLLFLDEFQVAVGNAGAGATSKNTPSARVRAALEEFSRQGRSARVRMVLASQSFNGNTMEDDLLENFGIKILGHCSREMNEAVLGKDFLRANQLDTSTMILDGDQAGTAAIVAPGIKGYILARGWFQPSEVVTALITSLPPKANTADGGEQHQDEPLPPLLAALDTHLHMLAEGGDDRAVIPTTELGEHANPEGLNATAYGRALNELGVPKVPVGSTFGRSVADINTAISTARRSR